MRLERQEEALPCSHVGCTPGAGVPPRNHVSSRPCAGKHDFETGSLVVRRGEGAKDRITVLAERLGEPLTVHLERVQELHRRDLTKGFGRVVLPTALERKYARAASS